MDVLRTGVSILAHDDPEVNDSSKPANLRKAERLLAQIPPIIAEYFRATKGQPAVPPKPELGFAANMLYMLSGKAPSQADAKAFDVSLILYAEHEFNASTFTARVVCSTESDLHASITAAIGPRRRPAKSTPWPAMKNAWYVNHSPTKPLSGGIAEMASAPIRKHSAVHGMRRPSPPI